MIEISASILSVDKDNSIKTFYNLETAGIDYFHIDVMDGKFVKNSTIKLMHEYATELNQITTLPLDIHLMVEDVNKYVDEFLPFSPNSITIHYEALKDTKKLLEAIKYIKQANTKACIAISPKTKIEEIKPILPYVYMALVMTVEPGKGGQELISETIDKIKELKKYILENNLDVFIEADGGINLQNIGSLKEAGVDIAVVGTALVKQKDYKEVVKKLKA